MSNATKDFKCIEPKNELCVCIQPCNVKLAKFLLPGVINGLPSEVIAMRLLWMWQAIGKWVAINKEELGAQLTNIEFMNELNLQVQEKLKTDDGNRIMVGLLELEQNGFISILTDENDDEYIAPTGTLINKTFMRFLQ